MMRDSEGEINYLLRVLQLYSNKTSTGNFIREILACLIIIFVIIIPLILKIRSLMRKFNEDREFDYETGESLTSSRETLRVPENGGVE